jgi:EAL domain-containing protein (putative c-di-GMP-specific phosphodiesterase class I)
MKLWNNKSNVSGNELIDKRFIERMEKRLIKYNVEPFRLQLEFTEHVLVSKEGSNLNLLNAIKRSGFAILSMILAQFFHH